MNPTQHTGQPKRLGVSGAIRAALMGAGLLFAGSAIAGPFGFDLKSSVEPSRAYSFCSELDDPLNFNFMCTAAPKLHSSIEVYFVRFVRGVGICEIRGASSYIKEDGDGIQLRKDWKTSKADHGRLSLSSHGKASQKFKTEPQGVFQSFLNA